MKTKTVLLLVVVAGFAYFAYLGSRRGGSLVGDSAPDFALKAGNTEARPVALTDFRGKWVLLNFWASWCPPCVQEMPSLERLKRSLEGRSVEVVAVSVDDGWPAVAGFLARFPLTMTVLLDGGGNIASRYGVFVLPHTYLIDPEGRIIQEYQGPRDWMSPSIVSEIESYVQKGR